MSFLRPSFKRIAWPNTRLVLALRIPANWNDSVLLPDALASDLRGLGKDCTTWMSKVQRLLQPTSRNCSAYCTLHTRMVCLRSDKGKTRDHSLPISFSCTDHSWKQKGSPNRGMPVWLFRSSYQQLTNSTSSNGMNASESQSLITANLIQAALSFKGRTTNLKREPKS